MSLSVVSSKFALLPDDDEDQNKKQLKTKVLGSNKPSAGNSNDANEEKKTKNQKKKNKKKKNANSASDDSKDLQALAFGQKRRSVSTSSAGGGLNDTNDEQLAHWVSQDQMVTDQAFAQDLQAAILASKVQYNEDCKHKEDLDAKKIAKKGAKMTLQEFNRLSIEKESKPSNDAIENDTFFEDVEVATKMALNREQIKESLQQRYQALPDQSLILQYKSILEEKDTQIANLLSNNEQLTGELDKIKKRYKQFRELLEQVECRQKAEIVSENMKLKKVQGEIFQEVHTLRQENEQLKTKLATMEKEKRK